MLRWGAAWVVCLAILAGCQSPAPIVVIPPPTIGPSAVPSPAPVRVYVSGAVATPGVYVLPAGALVDDALRAAGGALPEADLERINLAHELADQEHVNVPRQGEPVTPGRSEPVAPGLATVNINTATVEELEQLPRIGPVTAQHIVEFRTLNGPFQKIEDIMQVKGIGQSTFDQIKALITVGD